MHCGIDFGTSNSAITVVAEDGTVQPIPVEGTHTTIPSAMFFDTEWQEVVYGRAAIQRLVEDHEGRLLRALKTVLGTSLMQEGTRIGQRRVPFTEVLGGFLQYLKQTAEAQTGTTLTHVVMGRPVHFVDNDPAADAQAEQTLQAIAQAAGFTEVAFLYEPLAAALTYAQHLQTPELALVADIGGGTSDFSVIRLTPAADAAQPVAHHILANTGVRVGGTDVDRAFSLTTVMPRLGLGTLVRDQFSGTADTAIPQYVFGNLATWYKIPGLYTTKYKRFLADLAGYCTAPEVFERYINIIEAEKGHALAGEVEAAKIRLSTMPSTTIEAAHLLNDPALAIPATQADLTTAIADELSRIQSNLHACLTAAGVAAGDVSSIFLTGGTTALPAVREAIAACCPQAQLIDGDLFNSVAYGLGLDAARRWQA